MGPIEQLVQKSLSGMENLPDGMALVEERRKIGILMDFYTYGVYYNGTNLGSLHIVDAVTFRSTLFVGTNPGTNENVRLESYSILRDRSRFRRLEDYKASRQLPVADNPPELRNETETKN